MSFEFIDPEQIRELPGERIGLIAQEVEKVFPDWVEAGPDGYKRVTVRGLEALVVEALRELRAEKNAKIAQLEEANANMHRELNQKLTGELKRRDAENAELKQTVNELKALVTALAHQLNGGEQ